MTNLAGSYGVTVLPMPGCVTRIFDLEFRQSLFQTSFPRACINTYENDPTYGQYPRRHGAADYRTHPNVSETFRLFCRALIHRYALSSQAADCKGLRECELAGTTPRD